MGDEFKRSLQSYSIHHQLWIKSPSSRSQLMVRMLYEIGLPSPLFFLLSSFSLRKRRREKRRVDGEVNPGGHVLGGRSPHTKKRKTSAQNTAQDRDFTIRYRPSPGLPQNIRIRGASGRTVSISSIPRALTYSTKKGRKRIVLWLMTGRNRRDNVWTSRSWWNRQTNRRKTQSGEFHFMI